MPDRVVQVVPRNHRWEVSANGVVRRYIDWLCTKERAIEHALERARELSGTRHEPVRVVIETADGDVERSIVPNECPESVIRGRITDPEH